MFIRSKPNKSGSFSIQIIEKQSGKYKVLETVGVAKNSKEKQALLTKAKQRVEILTCQPELSFIGQDEQSIVKYLKSGISPQVKNIGPQLVLGKIFDSVGLNSIKEEMFRHITLARLVYPSSKLKTSFYLQQHYGIASEISSIYRFLDRFYKKHKADVERIIFDHSCKVLGKVSVVFYDMTTLYFEAEDEDDLRRIGFSKDGKFRHPQIMLGLLVGENGYPIGYDMFEGNKFEGHTLIPFIKNIENKYKLAKPIIVADSGLLSQSNIASLSKEGYEYIIGSRIKNETDKIKQVILQKAKELSDGKSKRINKKDGSSLIISYSVQRAKKDKHNRDKALVKLRKNISSGKLTKESINNRGYNKFLSIENEVRVSLDEEKIKSESAWDGLKGYATNSNLSASKVIDQYKELWKIETAFRISKTDLRIRPIYHRKRERIESHLCIAFAAYAIYKELERQLDLNKIGISAAKAIDITKTIFEISFTLPETGKTISIFSDLSDLQKKLINI